MRNTLIALSLAALLIAAGSVAFCQAVDPPAPPPPPGAGPGPGGPADGPKPPPPPGMLDSASSFFSVNALRVLSPQRMPLLVERLKLSEAQQTKISEILAKSEEEMRPLIKAQRQSAEEFFTGLTKVGLQEIEVQTGAELAVKAETAVMTQRIKTLFQVRAVLDAGQVETLNEMIRRASPIQRPVPHGDMIHRVPDDPAGQKAPETKPE